MSAYEDVFSALKTNAGLIALVPASRMYRHYVRDTVSLPAISYRRSGTIYHETIHAPPEAVTTQFAIVCVASTEDSAEAVGNAVEQVAGLRPLNREDEFDADIQVYATIVTVEVLTQF